VRPRRPGWIETASAHSRQDIARANRLGVHAVLFSAVFASTSPSAGAPLGALRFRRLVHSAGLPVYALGGVTAANAARAITGRAAGWAAIDAVRDAWGDAG
jgi:thiamine-phosphate pyrophosphorylase